MRVRYTPSASREFDEAVEYLLAQSPFVAAEFADSIEAAIIELPEYPYSAQETERQGVRRKYISRFRFSVFYSVDAETDELDSLASRCARGQGFSQSRGWPCLCSP